MHDYSDMFAAVVDTVYSAPRHYNNLGQELIAQKMYELIISSYTDNINR